MNNINKLALVALSLFLAVGVCACGDDDKKPGEGGGKVKVKITLEKDNITKQLRTGADVSTVAGTPSSGAGTQVDLTDSDITVKVTLSVTGEGSFDKEQLKKLTFKAVGCKKDSHDLKDGKTLDDLGVTELAKGKDAKFEIKWTNGLEGLAAVNKALTGGADDADYNNARQAASGDKDITLTGDGVDAEKATLKVKLTPVE